MAHHKDGTFHATEESRSLSESLEAVKPSFIEIGEFLPGYVMKRVRDIVNKRAAENEKTDNAIAPLPESNITLGPVGLLVHHSCHTDLCNYKVPADLKTDWHRKNADPHAGGIEYVMGYPTHLCPRNKPSHDTGALTTEELP